MLAQILVWHVHAVIIISNTYKYIMQISVHESHTNKATIDKCNATSTNNSTFNTFTVIAEV